MSVLNDKQIGQILTRMAYEIIEQNIDAKQLVLVGINNNGHRLANLLCKEIQKIEGADVSPDLIRVRLNAANPIDEEVVLEGDITSYKHHHVIIVDDVANTGRTLFFACKPFMERMVKKLQVAVLVDRKHKSWPIHVDFVGLSLATTARDHIVVELGRIGRFSARIS